MAPDFPTTTEDFHLRRLAEFEASLLHNLRLSPEGVSLPMMYSTSDLLTWEIRLHDDVRRLPKLPKRQALAWARAGQPPACRCWCALGAQPDRPRSGAAAAGGA